MPSTNSTKARQTRKGNRVARSLKSPRPDGKTLQDLVVDRNMVVVRPDIDIPWHENDMTEARAWEKGFCTLTSMSILSDIPRARWVQWRSSHADFPTPKGRELNGRTMCEYLYDARELGEWYKEHLDGNIIRRKVSRKNQRL